MKIGILGAGRVGGTLGRLWTSQGHQVMFGVRDPQGPKTQALLADMGPAAGVGSPAEAVVFGDVVLLAVSWAAVREVIEQAGPWTGKLLIDATNRLTPPTPDEAPSAAEDVARWAKDARVVKAFNATGSANMTGAPYGALKVDIFLCGDDAQAKAVVADLIASSGFDPVDCGPLANASLVELLAKLWMQLAFAMGNGPNIAFKLVHR